MAKAKPAKPRPAWGGRTGLILATIGAAVGLGNIWRFSYVAGENGGGAFLVVYVACVALIGLPLLIAELALGRAGHADAPATFAALAPGGRWHLVGLLGVVGSAVILSYYGVIAGWALRYLAGAIDGSLWQLAGEGYGGFFADFIAHPFAPLFWQLVMMALAMLVVAGGIGAGIERANRILMPILAFAVAALAVWSSTLPGAGAGYDFLFAPDWSALAKPKLYIAAIGQAFFSIGLGMAVFVTYGSYMARHESVAIVATATVIGDTLIALLAGIAIFGAVFAFGMNPAAGPQLAFITLPQIFLGLPFGRIAATLFFALLVAGALTSMMALLEVIVSWLERVSGLSRRGAVTAAGAAITLLGVPSSLGYGPLSDLAWRGRGVLDSVDFTVSSALLPLGGLLLAVFVGWRWQRAAAIEASGLPRRFAFLWHGAVRYLSPLVILVILFAGLFAI